MASQESASSAPPAGTNADLCAPALDVWSTIATDWDEGMGRDGNQYWQELEKPYLAKLLDEKKAKTGAAAVRALDISTGNGLTSRWLATFLGDGAADPGAVEVTATDGSPVMLERAKARAAAEEHPVIAKTKFKVLDVTKPEDFQPFESESFDVVLMNMAIMDVPTIEPLAAALPRILSVDGLFVASLLHPVFITSRARRTVEVVNEYDASTPDDLANTTTYEPYMRLSRYLDVKPWKGFAVPGQAKSQYYFHRPMHELLGTFLEAGLVLDGLEEPAFRPEHLAAAGPHHMGAASSRRFTQFPQIMVMRFRRIK